VHRIASRLDFSPRKATTLGHQANGALPLLPTTLDDVLPCR
jgi:hypothetical protein